MRAASRAGRTAPLSAAALLAIVAALALTPAEPPAVRCAACGAGAAELLSAPAEILERRVEPLAARLKVATRRAARCAQGTEGSGVEEALVALEQARREAAALARAAGVGEPAAVRDALMQLRAALPRAAADCPPAQAAVAAYQELVESYGLLATLAAR